jgi:hypothetical protein
MLVSSLLLFNMYMQSQSFSISNLVLAVPSTEILKWITDFHTSKHLKVPKCEIFENSDFDDFYTIKCLWGATFGLKGPKREIFVGGIFT